MRSYSAILISWATFSSANPADNCAVDSCSVSQPDILQSMYGYRTQFYINEFRKLEARGGQYSPISDETFTSQHYLGMEAVEHAWNELNFSSTVNHDEIVVLDAGGGLGGTSRYLASLYPRLTVVSVDFNNDFTEIARKLTARANLANRVKHETGDLLHIQDIWTGQLFDGVVSFLCFLHISDKKFLFKSISNSMKTGGKLYFEDLISPGNFISKEDLKVLKEDVSTAMPLLSKEEYSLLLESSGFQIESFVDMSESWSTYTNERTQSYREDYGKYVDVHGEAIAQSFLSFYDTIADLFQREVIKGFRVTCRKV